MLTFKALSVLAWVGFVLGAGAAVAESPATASLSVENVAPGDYAHFGQIALTTRDNAGDIANLGIIVGRDAVAVVDTGGSVTIGQRLLLAVRHITALPVR